MNFLTYFLPTAPFGLVYMLQQVEYENGKFLHWIKTMPSMVHLQKRQKLVLTARAKLTLAVTFALWATALLGGVLLSLISSNLIFLLTSLLTPAITLGGLMVFNAIFESVVVRPTENRKIAAAKAKLDNFKAVRIAVLGSYGKTSMKEMLLSVLSQAKNVAATPGNKNVPISHAEWINTLSGDEDILIFEYGEGAPGDIGRLASLSQPNYAVITGLAPAHLDFYPSLEAIADDFAAIQQFVEADKLFVNGESSLLTTKVKGHSYSQAGVDNWQVSKATTSFDGTSFTLSNGAKSLELHSQLVGLHQLGPLVAVAAVAMQLGLSDEQIIKGISQTTPFEHRMQPRALHGAWIIDDTYNGNIEGMRAGLELLKSLPTKRRIYVTPGLVDQGAETERVHQELGQLIAASAPDKVVLMEHSVTPYILKGLEAGGYHGEIQRESKPLDYYNNLEHFLAAGDVVMLQNDWPDAYV